MRIDVQEWDLREPPKPVDPCRCGHGREHHDRPGAGCAWSDCNCTRYNPPPGQPVQEWTEGPYTVEGIKKAMIEYQPQQPQPMVPCTCGHRQDHHNKGTNWCRRPKCPCKDFQTGPAPSW